MLSIRILFPIIFGLLGAAMLLYATAVFNRTAESASRTRAAVDHTQQVILALEDLLSLLRNAEGSQRGYVLSGNTEYLEPFNRAMADVTRRIEHLAELIDDNMLQRQHMAQLERLIVDKVAEMRAVIDVFRASGRDHAASLVRGGIGLRYMRDIEAIVDAMFAEEKRLLDERSAHSDQTFASAVTLAPAISLIALLFVLLALGWLVRELYMRARAEGALRSLTDSLEEQVRDRTRALEVEVVERENLGERLAEAQRLLSVGQLSAGVAHEFNNLFAVILG